MTDIDTAASKHYICSLNGCGLESVTVSDPGFPPYETCPPCNRKYL